MSNPKYYYRRNPVWVLMPDAKLESDLCWTCGHARGMHFNDGWGACYVCQREDAAGRPVLPDPAQDGGPCGAGGAYVRCVPARREEVA
jgi:hypothetical protein